MNKRQHLLTPVVSVLAWGAWALLQPAAAQIPTAPGTPIGTPLGSPGAIEAPQMAQQAMPATNPDAEDVVDPPGRVGRLSDVSGQAWLYSPDVGEWVSAEINRPLTTGDRLATDGDGRIEVRIGSTTVRLDGDTEVEFERLDDDRLALRLHNGSVTTRVRSEEIVREFELNTREGRFTVQRTGRYRFDRANDSSHVTVHEGRATYERPGSALVVHAGQHAEFWIDSQNVAQYRLTDPVRDAFAAWNDERDRSDDGAVAQRYVSPEMTGVEDLDRYGTWQENPEYGALWVPRTVASGWAPYTTGRWVWVSPWGWTWVDEAPWGFAPFHYGRWVYVGSRWCWSPGTYVHRPVYAPALVAWIGGPRLSVSLSIGSSAPAVGWVPLAPREVYVPYYRVSPRYVRNVNVTHVTNITNITTIVNNPQAFVGRQQFANRKHPHAVTVVPTDVLTRRRPVAPIAQQLRDRPDVRRIVNEPTRVGAIAAPPVAAPGGARRATRPEPGGAGAPRAGATPAPSVRTPPPTFQRPNASDAQAARPNVAVPRPGLTQNAAPTANPPSTTATPRPNGNDRNGVRRDREPDPRRGPRELDADRSALQAQQLQRAREAQAQRAQQSQRDRTREAEAARQRSRDLESQRAQQQQAEQAREAQAQQMQRARELQSQRAQQAMQERAADDQRRAAMIQAQQQRARAAQEQTQRAPQPHVQRAPQPQVQRGPQPQAQRAEPPRHRAEGGLPRERPGPGRGRD